MKLTLAFLLLAGPVLAQDSPVAPAPDDDGFSLVEEGARLVLRGLMTEMQPTLDEMGKALDEARPALEGLGQEIGPKFRQLIAMIDDIGNYEAPVMLPNGDILMRRTEPLIPKFEPKALPRSGTNGEIEL